MTSWQSIMRSITMRLFYSNRNGKFAPAVDYPLGILPDLDCDRRLQRRRSAGCCSGSGQFDGSAGVLQPGRNAPHSDGKQYNPGIGPIGDVQGYADGDDGQRNTGRDALVQGRQHHLRYNDIQRKRELGHSGSEQRQHIRFTRFIRATTRIIRTPALESL